MFNLDDAANPTDDFFGYVNNKWIAAHPIPPEESRWGSFSVLRVEVEKQLKDILDNLAMEKNVQEGSVRQKVRDFFLVANDMVSRNRAGAAPLKKFLDEVDAMDGIHDVARVAAHLHRNGISAWWTPYVSQDEKNTEVMAFHPYQGGISLPDRDYYLKDDEKSRDIRIKYITYMESMLPVAGVPASASAVIMDIETRLAEASRTRVALRDPEKQYNKALFSDAVRAVPHFDWRLYFDSLGTPAPEYFIVGQPEFMERLDLLLGTLPLDHIKAYLQWCVINDTASFLSESLEASHFDFYGRTFSGAKEMKPLWRRTLAVTSGLLDDAVAQLYVERHFSPEAKRRVNGLVDRLIAAYRGRIQALDWMGEETKKKAQEKLSAVSRKLGYPEKWKDYAPLVIGTDSYAENCMRAHAFEFDRQLKKIGKPVDRTEWYMSPQTVNACYEPTMNEILFPAAILQPPFFDPRADDATNFGGIGSVIGHELTHGFDDQGSQFDARGNLKAWWSSDDRRSFEAKAARLAEQFDRYEPLPGLHINGKLTLGENIADLGGLCIAYDGLSIALRENPVSGPIDGLLPEQRFFAGYAITECGHSREEYLRWQVQVDPHSPGRYRVNGPLSNMKEFYDAFHCKKGDGLWREPEERVSIW